ncbi:hypothetical protein ACLGI4_07220 [Streptomyces sp. HMX112]|uniref:hypothetical protein n=1 Tax=Streptomyces sp. HMX112 TaxID=3390850 RepID=UPI003A8121E5
MSFRDALRNAAHVDELPDLRLLPLGQDWDMVPAETGFLALARLRAAEEELGPVLYDRLSQRLYFAVPTGSGSLWLDLPVHVLGVGSWLVAPDPDCSDGHTGGWCELPDDETLTDPAALRRALEPQQTAPSRHLTAVPEETPPWPPWKVPVSTPTSSASPAASRPLSALPRS